MWYRCLNDMFGYCKGEPEFIGEKPSEESLKILNGRECKLDKAACGKHSTTHVSKETEDGRES